jgi:hypothetical protein
MTWQAVAGGDLGEPVKQKYELWLKVEFAAVPAKVRGTAVVEHILSVSIAPSPWQSVAEAPFLIVPNRPQEKRADVCMPAGRGLS